MPARLRRETWLEAALSSLLEGGPAAVAVEPLAARLGATKGSFYWHFDSREQLLTTALERWRERGTAAIIESVESGASTTAGTAQDRLRHLLRVVTGHTSAHPGELLLLGSPDPAVRAVVEQVTRDRIGYVARLLNETGLEPVEARRRALLAYAAYLGFAQLAAGVPAVFEDGAAGSHSRRELLETMADLLVGQAGVDTAATAAPGPHRTGAAQAAGRSLTR